jgi:hypothetical protein
MRDRLSLLSHVIFVAVSGCTNLAMTEFVMLVTISFLVVFSELLIIFGGIADGGVFPC